MQPDRRSPAAAPPRRPRPRRGGAARVPGRPAHAPARRRRRPGRPGPAGRALPPWPRRRGSRWATSSSTSTSAGRRAGWPRCRGWARSASTAASGAGSTSRSPSASPPPWWVTGRPRWSWSPTGSDPGPGGRRPETAAGLVRVAGLTTDLRPGASLAPETLDAVALAGRLAAAVAGGHRVGVGGGGPDRPAGPGRRGAVRRRRPPHGQAAVPRDRPGPGRSHLPRARWTSEPRQVRS